MSEDKPKADRSTGCICDQAGWCVRHQCRKSEHLWNLCRTRDNYFQLWEEGRGPGQVHPLKEPGLLRKALNFAWALWRHWRNRGLRVSGRAYRQRLAVCRECPSLDAGRMVCRERKCGCFVERKAHWASEHCPLRKWPGDEESEQPERESNETRRKTDAARHVTAAS